MCIGWATLRVSHIPLPGPEFLHLLLAKAMAKPWSETLRLTGEGT